MAIGVVMAGVLGLVATAPAQYTVTPDTGIPGAAGEKFNVSVVNQSESPVRFALRPKAGTWAEHTLTASQKGVYSCHGCGGTFEISIRTAGTTVTYDIVTGKLYAIRPNATRNIFDVYELK